MKNVFSLPVCVLMWRRSNDGLSKDLPQTSQGSIFRDGFVFKDCLPRDRTGKMFAGVSSITFTSNGTWFDFVLRFLRFVNDLSIELIDFVSSCSSSLVLFFGVETDRSNGVSDICIEVLTGLKRWKNLPCKESRISNSLWNIGLKRGKKDESGKRAIVSDSSPVLNGSKYRNV